MIKERECIKTALNDIIPNELNKINWNVKVYGKQGSYSIYVNNIKYDITDEQANKLKCFEKEYYNSDYYKYLYFQPTSFREIKNITLIED